MIKSCTLFSALLILALLNFNLSAQDEKVLSELSLDELLNVEINVASSKAETIFSTPSTVSVVDRNMIRQFQLKSVSEALNLIAGVDVARTYLKREIPTSRGILQDHYANKFLVLINGISTWNTVTGEANINRIDINDVERIEVLKGPGSVLYGTNAYSGAINIVLRSTKSQNVSTHFSFGDFGSFSAGSNYSYADDEFVFFVSGNSTDETGQMYSFTDEKKTVGNYFEYLKTKNFTVSAKYKGHSLLFNASRLNESYLGVDPNYTSGIGKDEVTEGTLLNYNFKQSIFDKLDLKYSVLYDWNQRNLSRTADDNTRSNLKGYRITNSLTFSYSPLDNLGLDLGFEYDWRKSTEYMNYNVRKDSVTADNDMNDRKATEYSVLLQASYQFSSFSLLAGTRFTHNEFFNNNISSRATLVYSIDDKNSLKLIWGQSFRAPSLFELYFRTASNTVFGNKDLEPETSNSIELAYLTSFDYFFIQALVYHSAYENKIFRVRRNPQSATDKSTIYANGSSFKADGVELEVKYQNAKVINAFVNYSYVKGDNGDEVDGNNHYNFKYVPQHTVSAGLYKDFSGFNASIMTNYISSTDGPLKEISDYITLDFGIGFKHSVENISLAHNLIVKNALDEIVTFPEFSRRVINEVPSGYGRRISYELRLEL